jgi:glucosylceramidase
VGGVQRLDRLGAARVGVDGGAEPLRGDALAGPGDDPQRVGSAFHAYAGSADAVEPLHAAHPDSPIWFTEQSGTQDPDKPYEADFADGIWWMSNQLFLPALRHHHQGVILFNLVLDQDGGPGPATFTNGTGLFQVDESTGALTPNSELYVMAHFSRFVPAGSPVLASPDAEDLPNVACLRPDGSVVVVLHNNAPARTIRVRAGDRELTVALPGWTLATCVLTERQQVRRR